MNILATVLDVICTFNEVFWLFYIVNIVFEFRIVEKERYRYKIMGGCIGACILIVFISNRIVLTSPYTFLFLLMFTIPVVCIVWKSGVVGAIAVVGSYYLALAVEGVTGITLIGSLIGEELVLQIALSQGIPRVIYLCCNGTFWLLVCAVASQKIKKIKINIESLRYIIALLIVGIMGSSFFISQTLISFNVQLSLKWYIFICLLSTLFLIIYFVLKKRALLAKLQSLNEQNNILERNYEQINTFYMTNAKLYHDMNHHLNAVYLMLEQGDEKQAKEYIESLQKPLQGGYIPVETGIDVVDAIFYEMRCKAEKKNIIFHVEGYILPQDMEIEKKDLCALFANMLENAIEAAEKEIFISVKVIRQMLFVQVKNDFKRKPVIKKYGLQTIKSDKLHHGWGTKIIEQIVDKYEGSIKYGVTGKYFETDIMLVYWFK